MKKENFIFEDKLFKIRETREKDTETWYKWFNNTEITKHLVRGEIPNTIENQKKYRSKYLDGKYKILFSILSSNNKLIGTCSINILNPTSSRRCEISMLVGEKKYNTGSLYLNINKWLINYSFNQLGMNSIIATFMENNIVVKKTVEFLGFKKIGLQRQRFYKDGRFQSNWLYDLLKEDWEKLIDKKK